MIRNKIQNHIITLMTFFFIFNVPFVFLPFGTGKIFSILGFLILFLHATLRKKLIFLNNDEVRLFLKFSSVLLIGSIVIAVFHRTYDFKIPYAYFLFIIEYLLGALSIVYFAKRFNKLSVEYILKRVNSAIIIQSFIVILMLVNEAFKLKVYSIMSIGDMLYNMSLRYGGIRGLGLATNTTYELSFVLSLGLIITVYFINNSKSIYDLIKLSITYMVILVGTLVVARTGWIGVAISIFLILNGKVDKAKLLIFSAKKAKFIMTSVIISTLVVISIQIFANDLLVFLNEKIIPFAFEMFINLFSEGSFETSSTNVLKEMYFPVSFKTFIIGDGRYVSETGNGYYMSTDAGYMRHILFSGLFSTLLYVFYLKIFSKIRNNLIVTHHKTLVFSFTLIAMYYFLVHAKGDLLMGANMAIKTIVLIYLFSSFERERM